MTEEPQRKYALIRFAAGDYCFLSNDTETLWRVERYWEDGSLTVETSRGISREIRGHFWQCSRFRGTPAQFRERAAIEDDIFDDRSNWETYSTLLRTRQEAIREALLARRIERVISE